MRIEPMTRADLDGVLKIENACFSRPWSHQSFEAELDNENSAFFTAFEDGKIIGYIGMNTVIDEGYIFNVAVDEQYRGRGVGYALVETLVTLGKKRGYAFITLEVRKSNQRARSLYSKFGFIKAGERKNYYSLPAEDAVLMTKFF